MKKSKVITRIFIVLLAIQAIIELGLGSMLLFDFQTTLVSAFGIKYSSQLDILGIALGLYLLLLTALMILSMVWTIKGKTSGTTLGVVIGAFLLTFGLFTFFQLGRTDGLIGDSIRGLLTMIFGYLSANELKNNKMNV